MTPTSTLLKTIKFVPFMFIGLFGGLLCGILLSMSITRASGGNPLDESTDVNVHTKIIVPMAAVAGAVVGVSKALK